jgi:hypothetical protein
MTVPDILRVDIEIYDENSRMLGGTSLRYDNIAQGQRHKPLPERKPMNNFEDAMKAALTVGVRGIMTSRGARASTPCGAHKERGAA